MRTPLAMPLALALAFSGLAVRAEMSVTTSKPLGDRMQELAQAGRFKEAVAAAEQARDLAMRQNEPDLARQAIERMQLYRAGRPYRETWPDPAAMEP